jgi:hypothetical protein
MRGTYGKGTGSGELSVKRWGLGQGWLQQGKTIMGRHKGYFPKIKEAREALREKAVEIMEQYIANAKEAQADGDYEVAAKSLQWLMEHMPADEHGDRVVETSVDKQKQQEKPVGPGVHIGIVVGGVQAPALPEPKKRLRAPAKQLSESTIIDVEPINE